MSRWLWCLSEMAGRLWVQATLYGFIGVVTALAALFLNRFIPEHWTHQIGADAVDGILNILAASMLSVTIFSLGAMVASYGAATNNVTPRATKLLVDDKVSHSALSTFIGAFVFSIVGIIALKTEAYDHSGRLVLFIVTIGVIGMILVTLLRWVEYLTRLGRVSETVRRVESATTEALEDRLRTPYMGGMPLKDEASIPADAVRVYAHGVGYVQHIDMPTLAHVAREHECSIYVLAPPGKFVSAAGPLVAVQGIDDEKAQEAIRAAFFIGEERSFRQDPRFGIAVLCEIGSRALSSSPNDAGTAIYVIGIGVRVLSLWAKRAELAQDHDEVKYEHVYVPPLKIDDLFDDFFTPIARDGANILEAMIRLQKAYQSLAATGDRDLISAANYHADLSLKRSLAVLSMPEDRERLEAVAAELLSPSS
jgi:uncharacterized membrane protein